MSLLLDILGGGLEGLGAGMVELDRREQDYLAEKRRLAEAERQYQRNRKDKIADERRTLGREVDYYDKDYTAKTVTPVFKDGTRGATRPMTQDEMMAWRKSEKNLEYQDAVMESMRDRGTAGGAGGGSPKPPTDSEARAAAIMLVGPEPDREVDPEGWADWQRKFNAAFLAAKRREQIELPGQNLLGLPERTGTANVNGKQFELRPSKVPSSP